MIKQRESIDILPTLLDLTETQGNDLPGKSIIKFLKNKDSDLENKSHVFSETGALQGPYPSPMEPNVFCVKNSKYKLIFFETPNEWRLFDLVNDPMEKKDIFDENSENELQIPKASKLSPEHFKNKSEDTLPLEEE